MFYLRMHSTHFIYGYMALDVVKYHSDSERRSLLAPLHGLLLLNSTHHILCYISCEALAGMRNSSIGPP